MWRPLRTSLISLSIMMLVYVLALTGWSAWDHRPYTHPDWQAAFQELSVTEKSWRLLLFERSLTKSGVSDATLDTLRQQARSSLPDRQSSTYATSPDTLRKRASKPRCEPDYDCDRCNPSPREIRTTWNLYTGGPHVLTFAVKHWHRPELVNLRAKAWLHCSNTELFDMIVKPEQVRHSQINRAFYHLVERRRHAPTTKFERRRRWCGETLSRLSRETEADLPHEKRRLGQHAKNFGNFNVEIDRIAGLRPNANGDNLGWHVELTKLAGFRNQGAAKVLLAERLFAADKYYIAPHGDGVFLSAFWATLAVGQDEDATHLLHRAKSRLTSNELSSLNDAVNCWHGLGSGLFGYKGFMPGMQSVPPKRPQELIAETCDLFDPSFPHAHVRRPSPRLINREI